MFLKTYRIFILFVLAYMIAALSFVIKMGGGNVGSVHVWSNYLLVVTLVGVLLHNKGFNLHVHISRIVALSLIILISVLLEYYVAEMGNRSLRLSSWTYPFFYYLLARYIVRTKSDIVVMLKLLMISFTASVLMYYYFFGSIYDILLVGEGVRASNIIGEGDSELINTNVISYIALSLFICAVAYVTLQVDHVRSYWLIILTLLFALMVIMINQTRSALLILFVFMFIPALGKDRILSVRHVWILLLMIVLFAAVVDSYIGNNLMLSFMDRYSDATDDSRIVEMEASWQSFIDNPLAGDPSRATNDHCFYTFMLSQFGVLGSAIYMVSAFWVVKTNATTLLARSILLIILVIPIFTPFDVFYGALFFSLYALSADSRKTIHR